MAIKDGRPVDRQAAKGLTAGNPRFLPRTLTDAELREVKFLLSQKPVWTPEQEARYRELCAKVAESPNSIRTPSPKENRKERLAREAASKRRGDDPQPK